MLAFGAIFTMQSAEGHEFWIEPEDYAVASGARIVANIRVGEDFDGSAYAFIPPRFHRFDVATAQAVAPVEARMGDRPAVDIDAPADGLVTLIHVTTDMTLKYSEWAKFVKFVTHKDAVWTLEAHRARELPDVDFVEAYSRHAKSLIAVGDGAGKDRSYGLETEIVALENPYRDDMTDGLDVQVFYQGAPRPAAQVEIFAKAPDGAVDVSIVTADAQGVATVPVIAGHSYLVDSVVLRNPAQPLADKLGAVWESLWASLTFAIPS